MPHTYNHLAVIPQSFDDLKKNCEDEKSSNKWFSNFVSSMSGNSRLADYEILKKLGSGGFGEVFKVRHRLDQCYYALKKIPINASNLSINRKIMHEVKYLSRLNHENVVRYYGTWVECMESGESSRVSSLHSNEDIKVESPKNEVTLGNFLEIDGSSEEEDLAEENIFSASILWSGKSDGNVSEDYVVFQDSNNPTGSASHLASVIEDEKSEERQKKVTVKTVMYIQMELCEKNTLRNAIDSRDLCSNLARRRRLFREIVEGLVHIHEHGIIHRDLKPGNIFLDSGDHVKIGDFGLATKSEMCQFDDMQVTCCPNIPFADNHESKQTGIVGTFLYIAPELRSVKGSDSCTSKIVYTQKVDIYSLGIILFEMCYPPTNTNSERIKLLNDLRKPEIHFPSDVEDFLSPTEMDLLRFILKHNHNERPSSTELLKSSYLPPPKIEIEEQQNALRHIIANPQNKTHHFMLNLLFERESNLVEDFVYDFNEEVNLRNQRSKKFYNNPTIRRRVYQFVCSTIEQLFQRYGAVQFTVPTFMPYLSAKMYDTADPFRMMDPTGFIVCPPYDLRLPFARFVARNKIFNLRRYSIEKVFRGRKMNYHPRELFECAFDIITNHSSSAALILPETEIINLLNDLIQEFLCLRKKHFILRINHIQLIKALLSYYDISEDRHSQALSIIGEGLGKAYTLKRFLNENFADSSKVNQLLNILDLEKDSVNELQSAIRCYLRKKQTAQVKAAEMIKASFQELKWILDCVKSAANFNLKIKISLSLAVGRYYSGTVFRLEEEICAKQNTSKVFAIGGRYDDIIEQFQVPVEKNEDRTKKVGVGVSAEIEKIVRYVIEDEFVNQTSYSGVADVLIWSLDREKSLPFLKTVAEVANELRSNKIKTMIFKEEEFSSLEALSRFCAENSIKHVVVINEAYDSSNKNYLLVKVYQLDKESYIVEKKSGQMMSHEIVDMLRSFFTSNSNTNETGSRCEMLKSNSGSSLDYSTGPKESSAPSISSFTDIRFYPVEHRLLSNTRKRYIAQINSMLSILQSNSSTIAVFALELPFKIVKSIVSEMNFDENASESEFDESVKQICEKWSRYRTYISNVMQEIYEYQMEHASSMIALVSYIDMKFIILS